VLVRASEDCTVHGKALRKRGQDDWYTIMGATLPNQTESSEKVGVTPIH
jgi:methylmalonyl-CoA mutase cobalamin-binding subunit